MTSRKGIYRLTDPVDVGIANFLVVSLFYRAKELQAHSARLNRAPKPLLDHDAEASYRNSLGNFVRELAKYKAMVVSWVLEVANKYTYVRYLVDSSLVRESLVAILANPPDVTWGREPLVNPSTWLNVAFIPVFTERLKQRNLYAKLFYSRNYNLLLYKKLLHTRDLANFYDNKVNSYISIGRSKAHAHRLARRDLLRVFIGNTWLIATLEALDKGVLSPRDIRLPYHLEKNPSHAGSLLDPEHTLPENKKHLYRNYTWRKLLETINIENIE